MNFNQLLNQVLGSVSSAGKQTTSGASNHKDLLMKVGGGAAAAGLLSSLMKRKTGTKLVQAGSMAALGALAYHAYQNWQRNQTATSTAAAPGSAPLLPASAFEHSGPAAEAAGRVILRTMIAAAAADGQIDEAEHQLIAAESGDDPELQQWLAAETLRPATPVDIAGDVGNNPAVAAEAYLAARMVCGDLSRKEIVFLSQLAQALQLDDAFIDSLEQQAGF